MTLTCAASVYEFSDIGWYKRSNDDEWTKIETSPTDVFVVRNDTSLSRVGVLTFASVAMADAGRYACRAERKKGEEGKETSVMLEKELEVLSVLAPTRAEGNNMNGSEILIDTSGKLSLR